MTVSRDDETAGAIEPFEDAALYDWEYRRRRDDVRFYRTLAGERGGPVLDLACGTGRLLAPLLRDGHVVVGLDRSAPMLARAAARVRRLAPGVRARAALLRADLRAFAFRSDGNPGRVPAPSRDGLRAGQARAPSTRGPFVFAVCAFHSIQHLTTDAELLKFLRAVRAALIPGGWFAFDVFVPEPTFLARPPQRRWDRTLFRHPGPGKQRFVYTMASPRLSDDGRALLMTMHYQPVDGGGRPRGPEIAVRLCHRQLPPATVDRLLNRAGLQQIGAWSSFDGAPPDPASEQHIYLARRP